MILFVNDKNEIKDVNTTDLEGLTALEVNDENNPFSGWSIAKICCYKVNVTNGIVTMMTPYVDTKIIEHIEQLGKTLEETASDICDTRSALIELYEMIGE